MLVDYVIDWSAISAIGTLFTTLIITVTALFTYRQVKELEKQRCLSNALQQFDKLNEPFFIEARRKIYELESYKSTDNLIASDNHIERYLNLLNQVGFLLSNEHLPWKITLEMFYVNAIRSWFKMHGYILQERDKRGIYLNHFQWLVEKSLEYWGITNSEAQIHIHCNKTGIKHIISRHEMNLLIADIKRQSKRIYKIGV